MWGFKILEIDFKDEKSHHVDGEIICVDDEMLKSLDVFEDVPSYYSRLKEVINVNEVLSLDDRIGVLSLDS